MSTELVRVDPLFAELMRDDSIKGLLDQFGVVPENIRPAPVADVTVINFENLCTNHEPIDRKGFSVDHDGHTGPMMYLGMTEDRESDEYAAYWGYLQVAALHPVLGRTLTSVSIPASFVDIDGNPVPNSEALEGAGDELHVKKGFYKAPADNDLLMWLRNIKPGNLFTIARMPTRKPGRHVYRPVPVQGLSEASEEPETYKTTEEDAH